jgi:hypothetical protein
MCSGILIKTEIPVKSIKSDKMLPRVLFFRCLSYDRTVVLTDGSSFVLSISQSFGSVFDTDPDPDPAF